MKIQEAAKEYADNLYESEERGVLYRETQNDFIAGAEWMREIILKEIGERRKSIRYESLGVGASMKVLLSRIERVIKSV